MTTRAVLIDASLVRMMLVPAVMALFGKNAWWMPRWMEPIVPHLRLEGSTEPAPGPVPEPAVKADVEAAPAAEAAMAEEAAPVEEPDAADAPEPEAVPAAAGAAEPAPAGADPQARDSAPRPRPGRHRAG